MKLAETTVKLEDGQDISFTVSIGASCLNGQEEGLADLLNRADAALYNAKEQGRNKVVSA